MNPPLAFTKMHGLGNDFIIINHISQKIDLMQINIPHLSDRRLGIGFDQLLLIEPGVQADFFCRIYNADGSEAEQCGNGLRCVARYIHENKLHNERSFTLETVSGIFPVSIQNYAHIQITMNIPIVTEPLVKLTGPLAPLSLSILAIGNPHAVAVVDSLETVPADLLASQISSLSWFPNGTNVGFMQIISPKHIRLRTIERGAGETPACGSNACAAVTAGIINKQLEHKVIVEYQHGCLEVEWQGENKPILMTGPAERVFEGLVK